MLTMTTIGYTLATLHTTDKERAIMVVLFYKVVPSIGSLGMDRRRAPDLSSGVGLLVYLAIFCSI